MAVHQAGINIPNISPYLQTIEETGDQITRTIYKCGRRIIPLDF